MGNQLVGDLNHRRIDGAIVDSGHAAYDKCRRVWNAMADRRPAVIVRAASVADVEKTVSCAAEHSCLLAVRGGGHSLPGLSICDQGIVLDLSRMNTITVDRPNMRAIVSGGALLGDVDKATIPAGIVVPAGVVSHTGVAGLTLGGGMGWLSRRFGLTIDSLLAAEIVTADGCRRMVSADTETDLFWAIRGGGGNFGVVTNFVFQTHQLGHVLIGSWAYKVSDTRSVLVRYRELVGRAPRELSSALVLTSTDLLITAVWTGDSANAEAAVVPFGTLGNHKSGSLGRLAFIELQKRSDERLAWNRRNYAKGGYLSAINDAAIDRMIDSITTAPSLEAEFYVLQLGGAIADVAEDATPYTGRAAGHYWIAQAAWDQKDDDPRFLHWTRHAAASLTAISMKGNYVNEQADAGNEVARQAYGEHKYARLAELKARFDPGNLFRLNQNIEPTRASDPPPR